LYEVWSGLDGEELRPIGPTTDTTLSARFASGEATWFVRALFNECPPRDSAEATFRSTSSVAPVAISEIPQHLLTRPVAVPIDGASIVVADAGTRSFFNYDTLSGSFDRLRLLGDIGTVPLAANGSIFVGPGNDLYIADRGSNAVPVGYPPLSRAVFLVLGRCKSPVWRMAHRSMRVSRRRPQ